jgi:hydrogenase/urease accessory protein HupE
VTRLLVIFCAVTVCALSAQAARAHEVRPAYLEISQPDATTCRVTWKQPMTGELAIRLVPHLSNGWLERKPADQYASAGFLIRTWTIEPCASEALAGTTIAIEGLQQTITDVFVRIRLHNGWREDAILRPDSSQLVIPPFFGKAATVPAYLLLGIEHILSGVDHLLFVLGLLLLVRDRWMLLKAVSAFTVAHSITLAAALLAGMSLPAALVEALIALSILFLASEILRARDGGTSLTIRYPWAVAFVFGLFHGMGFAGGLASLGYAKQDLAAALVFFNVGVEVGQLGFIAIMLMVARALRSFEPVRPYLTAKGPAYVVGIAGAYWTFQTSALLTGLSG